MVAFVECRGLGPGSPLLNSAIRKRNRKFEEGTVITYFKKHWGFSAGREPEKAR